MIVALTLAGITAPALLLVAALRRWIEPVPWRAAAVFLVVTLAFLHGAVFTSKLPVPVDEVARGDPFRGLFGDVHVKNPMTNDVVKLFLPWMQICREQLFRGELPLWNPYAFGGYPLLANAEAAPFSPLFVATLFVPLPKQLVAMAGLKIFVALLFTWLLVKREGGSDAAAAFAALAFALSSFHTIVLYYSTSAVTVFLPAVLYAMLLALERPSRRHVVFVALAVFTICANGHPESVVHIGLTAAIVLAIELACARDRREWWSRFRAPLFGSVAGLVLAMPIWLPAAQQVLLSTRYAALRAAPPMKSYPLTAAWALLNPNGFGNPARGNWSWILNYMTVAESYVGLLMLAAFAAACLSPRLTPRLRAWAAAAVILFLCAMGWSVVGRAFNAVPPFDTAANDKLRFAALLLGAVVAALWLDRAAGERRLPFAAIAVVLIALALYVWQKQRRLMQPTDLVGAVALAAFAVVWFLPRRRTIVIAACALTTLELFVFNCDFNRLVDAKYFRPRLPIVEALRRHAPREPFRVAGFDWTLLPNAAGQYGLEDVRGSDPMSSESYTKALEPITAVEPGTDVARIVDVESPLLDRLNVRFLFAGAGASFGGRWRLVYSGRDGTLFENERARPRFFAEEGASISTEARSSSSFRLRVRASRAATVRSSQPAAPGWRLRMDGKRARMRTEEGAFLAFDVPAGEHVAEITYAPAAFYGALPAALAAALALMFVPAKVFSRDSE